MFEYEDGSCYMRLFDVLQVRLPLHLRWEIGGAMHHVLGEYPEVTAVVAVLDGLFGADCDVAVPLPVFQGECLHVPPPNLALMIPYTYVRDWMLIEHRDHCIGGDSNLRMDNVNSAQFLGSLGVDVSALLVNAVRVSAGEDPAVRNAIGSLVVKELADRLRHTSGGLPFTCDSHLTVEEKDQLVRFYPEFDIKFRKGKGYEGHPMARTMRLLSMERMLQLIGYRNDIAPGDGYDHQVIDIGGDYMQHLRRGRRHIHSCAPVLTAQDDKRHNDRLARIKFMSNITPTQRDVLATAVETSENESCSLFCLTMGQECKRRAPALIFNHSVYDMSNQDVADCMDAHNAIIAYGAVMFSPMILYRTKGELKDVSCHFRKEGKQIKFKFAFDPSYEYHHDFSKYIQFFREAVLVSSRGVKYYLEFMSDSSTSEMLFKITRATMGAATRVVFQHSFFCRASDQMVKIVYWDYDATAFPRSAAYVFKRRVLYVNKEFASSLLHRAASMQEAKFKIKELFQFACSYAKRIIINGMTVLRNNAYNADVDGELFKVVSALYFITYRRNYQEGKVIQFLMDQEKLARERGLWATFREVFVAAVGGIGERVKNFLLEPLFKLMIATLDYEVTVASAEFTVTFQTMLKPFYTPSCTAYLDLQGSMPLDGCDLREEAVTSLVVPRNIVDSAVEAHFRKLDAEAVAPKPNFRVAMRGGSLDIMRLQRTAKCCLSIAELVPKECGGDGNCQYLCIAFALGLKDTPSEMRRKMLALSDLPPSFVSEHSPENAWGDEMTLYYLSTIYDFTACVHLHGESKRVLSVDYLRIGAGSRQIHLFKYDNHYQAGVLVPPKPIAPKGDAGKAEPVVDRLAMVDQIREHGKSRALTKYAAGLVQGLILDEMSSNRSTDTTGLAAMELLQVARCAFMRDFVETAKTKLSPVLTESVTSVDTGALDTVQALRTGMVPVLFVRSENRDFLHKRFTLSSDHPLFILYGGVTFVNFVRKHVHAALTDGLYLRYNRGGLPSVIIFVVRDSSTGTLERIVTTLLRLVDGPVAMFANNFVAPNYTADLLQLTARLCEVPHVLLPDTLFEPDVDTAHLLAECPRALLTSVGQVDNVYAPFEEGAQGAVVEEAPLLAQPRSPTSARQSPTVSCSSPCIFVPTTDEVADSLHQLMQCDGIAVTNDLTVLCNAPAMLVLWAPQKVFDLVMGVQYTASVTELEQRVRRYDFRMLVVEVPILQYLQSHTEELVALLSRSTVSELPSVVLARNLAAVSTGEVLPPLLRTSSEVSLDSAGALSVASTCESVSTVAPLRDTFATLMRLREEIDADEALSLRLSVATEPKLPSGVCIGQIQCEEILDAFEIPSSNVLDLAAAPGGYCREFLRRGCVTHFVSFSNAGTPSMYPDVLMKAVDITPGNGDLTKQITVRTLCEGFVLRFDVVTADGLVAASGIDLEGPNAYLVRNQCAIIREVTAYGGSAFIAVHDLHLSDTRAEVLRTAEWFAQFHFFRSHFTPVDSGKIFVVFVDRLVQQRTIARREYRMAITSFLGGVYGQQIDVIRSAIKGIMPEPRPLPPASTPTSDDFPSDEITLWDLTDDKVVMTSYGVDELPGEYEENSQIPMRATRFYFPGLEEMPEHLRKLARVFELVLVQVDGYLCFIVNYFPLSLGKVMNYINTRYARNRLTIHLSNRLVLAREPLMSALKALTTVQVIKHNESIVDDQMVRRVKRALAIPRTGEAGWVDLNINYEMPEDTRDARARNAIRERIGAWERERPTIESGYQKALQEFLCVASISGPRNAARVMHAQAENYVVIDVLKCRYVLPPIRGERNHEYGFDGKALIPLEYDRERIVAATSASYVLAGDATRLLQSEKLLRVARSIDFSQFSMPKVILVAGVPGCGKTKDIVDTHVRSDGDTRGDLVLSSSTENAQELRERSGAPNDRINYRTMHSYLMHARGAERHYQRVFIDEALMAHAGEICLIACMTKCTTLILMGDPHQIPYINRMLNVRIVRASIIPLANHKVERVVSYRITPRTAAMWEHVYGIGKIKTTSQCMNHFQLTPVSDIAAITDRRKQYLTFKQHEKSVMQLRRFKCSTVHEYQGKQCKSIGLWRSSVLVNEHLYKSEPHMLVATTRHTEDFEYLTGCASDILCEHIRKANQLTDDHLQQYVVDPHSLSVEQPVLSTLLFNIALRGGNSGDAMPVNLPLGEDILPTWGWGYLDKPSPQYSDYVFRGGDFAVGLERPYLLHSTPIEVTPHRVKMKTTDSRVEFLQDWYDRMLPGNSTHDLSWDNTRIQWGDFEVTVDNVVLDMSKHVVREPHFDRLRPMLRTTMPFDKPMSQIEMLRGFAGRNSNVPRVSGLRSVPDVIKDMAASFKTRCIEPNLKGLFYEYLVHPIILAEESIAEWRENSASRPPGIVEHFFGDEPLDYYSYLSKLTSKADLTKDAPYKIGAPQMIACHGPDVNVFFAPIFRELKDRLLKVLHRKIHIFSDCTTAEYAAKLTTQLGEVGEVLEALELDIGKYDKSQDELALEWDCCIMEMFGVDDRLIMYWRNAHRSTVLMDKRTGLKADVPYQRKSGDAFTFMGNTTFLLGVFALIFPVQRLAALLIGGDDTLAIGRRVKRDASSVFASVFNLEAKLLHHSSWYFCSKFVLRVDDRYVVVPDPLKLITKLGRADLVNWEHAEEYRVSLTDLCTIYNDVCIIPALNVALADRYPSDVCDHSYLIQNLLSMIKSSDNFQKLYYSLPTDRLCMDPKRPKID